MTGSTAMHAVSGDVRASGESAHGASEGVTTVDDGGGGFVGGHVPIMTGRESYHKCRLVDTEISVPVHGNGSIDA